MIFSVIVIVFIGAVAYFHYVQGFFSAAISAILTILAAVLAMSFHEPIIRWILGGKMADQATALTLVALFIVIYLIMRTIFDAAVPGNIRLPVTFDKIGAGVMGLIAGIFCMGIFAIAAQSMPFGPSVAGYGRYLMADKQDARVGGGRTQQLDSALYDVLKLSDTNGPADHNAMIIPADDIVVGLTSRLSEGGALSGSTRLSAVHPAFLDELFFQRLGVQTGAKHVAVNTEKEKQVELRGLFTIDSIPQADADGTYFTNRWQKPLDPLLKSTPDKMILIVRVMLSRNASDVDTNVRISTGGIRLVFNGENYIPIGTIQLEGGPIVRVNRPDDFIIVKSDATADFVYLVPREICGDVDPKNKAAELKIADGVFVEAKRMADIDLAGKTISREAPTGADGVQRKKDLPGPKVAPGAGGSAAKEVVNGPIDFTKLTVSSQFFTDIAVGAHDGADADVTFRSGKGKLHDGKLAKVEVEPTDTITIIRSGDSPIRELWTPAGQKLVQIVAVPTSKSPWDWADKLGQFELIDDKNGSFKPRGAWVKVKQGASDHMIAKYDAENAVTELSYNGELRPTDLWIAFVVPEGTTIKEVRFDGKRLKSLSQVVQ